MDIEWLTLVLQTSDPLFPTGAYAHSNGLEEIVRLGIVRDEETLRAFLQRQILPMLERLELPYLLALRGALDAQNFPALVRLDRELSAVKIAAEARAESLAVGRQRLRMLLRIAPTAALAELSCAVQTDAAAGHHLTVFAVQMAAVPREVMLQVWLYQTLAGACSASLKLIRIGQEGCQRVLRHCLDHAGETVARALSMNAADIGCFNPLRDIASMRHATAPERMFIT